MGMKGRSAILVAVGLAGCAARLQVSPSSAAPGDIVRISSDEATFARPPARISIAGKSTTTVTAVNEREADVVVPAAPAGAADVEVRATGGKDARGKMVVLPARTMALVFSVGGSEVRLLAAQGTGGDATRGAVPPAIRYLSFDVINAKGGLAFTGVVPSPLAGREVFEGPNAKGAKLHQTAPPSQGVAAIKVPNIPKPFVVRLYDVPAGTDLRSPAGRQARRLVGEVTIKDEGSAP